MTKSTIRYLLCAFALTGCVSQAAPASTTPVATGSTGCHSELIVGPQGTRMVCDSPQTVADGNLQQMRAVDLDSHPMATYQTDETWQQSRSAPAAAH